MVHPETGELHILRPAGLRCAPCCENAAESRRRLPWWLRPAALGLLFLAGCWVGQAGMPAVQKFIAAKSVMVPAIHPSFGVARPPPHMLDRSDTSLFAFRKAIRSDITRVRDDAIPSDEEGAAAAEEEEPEVEPLRKGKPPPSVDAKKGSPNALKSDQVKDAPVNPALIQGLLKRNISTFTPVQVEAYGPVFDGQDVLARSRTGTGKTLAFGLPLVVKLGEAQRGRRARDPKVLILAPTRELVRQTLTEMQFLGSFYGLTATGVYGGAAIGPQKGELRRGVDIVVATPGRLMDLLDQNALTLDDCSHVILDEADEMLNMGFAEDVECIMRQIPNVDDTQVMLFSATMPSWVNDIARSYQKNPYRLDVVGAHETRLATTITHYVRPTPSGMEDKLDALVDVLDFHSKGGMVLCFVDTKVEAHWMSEQRRLQMFSPCFLHGDLSQALRDQTMEGLRAGKFRVLVATDVASRGIDIEGIEVVVQWTPPRDSDTYVHRSGRTGRAGRAGTAITFFTPGRDGNLITRLGRDLDIKWRVSWPFTVAAKQALKLKEVVNAVKSVKDAEIQRIQPQVMKVIANVTGDAAAAAQLPDASKALLARLLSLLLDTDNAAANQRSMLTGKPHTTTFKLSGSGLHSTNAVIDMLRYAVLDADPTEHVSLAGVVPLRDSSYLVDIKGAPENWEGTLRPFLASGASLRPATELPDTFAVEDLNHYVDFQGYLRRSHGSRASDRGMSRSDDNGSRGRFGGRRSDQERGSGRWSDRDRGVHRGRDWDRERRGVEDRFAGRDGGGGRWRGRRDEANGGQRGGRGSSRFDSGRSSTSYGSSGASRGGIRLPWR